MLKTITIILLSFLLFISNADSSLAQDVVSGSSAVPKFKVAGPQDFDYREYTLRKFLGNHRSPLTPYSADFIKTADYYNIDWRMVPAISGVESTFGKRIPYKSYNAYGWANGKFGFKSWQHSITVVNKTLRENYINKGATSVAKISRIYAPPSLTWGRNVNFFIAKISPMPLSFDI